MCYNLNLPYKDLITYDNAIEGIALLIQKNTKSDMYNNYHTIQRRTIPGFYPTRFWQHMVHFRVFGPNTMKLNILYWLIINFIHN